MKKMISLPRPSFDNSFSGQKIDAELRASLTAIVLSYLLTCSVMESSTCRANQQVADMREYTRQDTRKWMAVRANGPEFFDPENIRRKCQLCGYLTWYRFDALTDGCVEARSLRTAREQIKLPVNRSTYLYLILIL